MGPELGHGETKLAREFKLKAVCLDVGYFARGDGQTATRIC